MNCWILLLNLLASQEGELLELPAKSDAPGEEFLLFLAESVRVENEWVSPADMNSVEEKDMSDKKVVNEDKTGEQKNDQAK